MDKNAKINFWFSITFIIIALILTLSLILAAITWATPISGKYNNSKISYSLTLVQEISNVSKYYSAMFYKLNSSATWIRINSSSYNKNNWTFYANNSGAVGGPAKNYTINGTIFFKGVLSDGNYSFNISLGNSSSNYTAALSSSVLTSVVIDTTAPRISSVEATNRTAGVSLVGVNISTAGLYDSPIRKKAGYIGINVTIPSSTNGVNVTFVNVTLYNGSGKPEGKKGNISLIRVKSTNDWLNQTASGKFGIGKFNATVWRDGNYSIKVWAKDRAGNVNNSYRYEFVIDSGTPMMYAGNASVISAYTGRNISSAQHGLLKLNVTVTDKKIASGNKSGISLISSVTYIITNKSGAKERVYAASREAGTIALGEYTTADKWSSATLNTSLFADGSYNVFIIVNDSAQNTNQSVKIYNLTFDNTSPTVSMSCTPSSVGQGSTETCTCSASDATAGLNTSFGSSGKSYTVNPSTSLTGTFTVYCSAMDKAGNEALAQASYTVTGRQDPSSTSGGTTSSTPASSTSSSAGTVSSSSAASVAIENPSEYGVESIDISVKEDASDVEVSIDRYANRPVEVTVSKAGKVYKYLQIEVSNVGDKLEKAVIKARVSKAWAVSNGLIKDDIAVFKFIGGDWKQLPTAYDSEDSNAYYYNAETVTFSYFAIGEKKGEEVLTPETEKALAEAEKTEAGNYLWWIVGIIVVLAIIVAAAALIKKRK